MIDLLLPPGVGWAERFDDAVPDELLAGEEAVVARAVPKRRREFVTGRWCARQALAQLGVAPTAILPGERGAPGWPAGMVGAITHCDGYRAAAVARTAQVRTIGVDAEPNAPLPDGVLALVSLPPEREEIAALARREPALSWDRLLFSAKESVYKAWFPLARRWLGFTDARVRFQPDGPASGEFVAELLADGTTVTGAEALTGFSGRWLVADGLVVTAIVVPVDRR
jgi:4'-phosphopantetheinyl transferase EntD